MGKQHKLNSRPLLPVFLLALAATAAVIGTIPGARAQTALSQLASVNACMYAVQLSFHPTDPNILGITCQIYTDLNTDTVIIYDISTLEFNEIAIYQYAYQNQAYGFSFSPIDGSIGIGTVMGDALHVFNIASNSITQMQTFTIGQNIYTQVAISPSGQRVMVACVLDLNQFALDASGTISFVATVSTIPNSLCESVYFYDESTLLVGCYGFVKGLYQFDITDSGGTYSHQLQSASDVTGITMSRLMPDVGFFSDYTISLLQFSFDTSTSPSTISQPVQVMQVPNLSIMQTTTLNWQSTMMALTLESNVVLYLVGCDLYACTQRDANNVCTACTAGYFPDPDTLCCKPCPGSPCTECSDATTCTACVQSSPARVPADNCACPSGYYEDPLGTQCQQCVQKCSQCSTGTNCDQCVGPSTGANARLAASACACPDGFYDDGTDTCQACALNCVTCTSGINCDSCVGPSTGANARLAASMCACPDGFYDDGTDTCQACYAQCTTCTSYSDCVTCVGPATGDLARLPAQQCVCPDGYFDDGSSSECQPSQTNEGVQPTSSSECIYMQKFLKEQENSHSLMATSLIAMILLILVIMM